MRITAVTDAKHLLRDLPLRQLILVTIGLLLAARFVLTASPVQAACPASFPVTVPASDTARLIEVIGCANATASNDVIDLTNSTYTLTTPFVSDNGLPRILNATTAGTLTINGNGATITRSSAGGTPEFRLLFLNGGANLTLNNIILTNGLVSSSRGAGIVNSSGTLTVNASTIQGNTANRGAGVFSDINSTTTLRDTTLSSNTAGDYGGAIENSGATLNVINSTISGNAVTSGGSSRGGGAIGTYGTSAVTITNSTITNNTAPTPSAQRSGIWQEAGTLTIQNSIVANNNGANNCNFTGGTRNVASNNLDNGTSCGFSGTVGQNTNPLLGTLDNNGGPTQTHALLPGSPAMNAGDNTKDVDQNGAALTTDQRGTGYSRILGATVDIGAYESACTGSPYAIPAGDTTLLIEAIKCANATASNDVIDLASASTYTLTKLYVVNNGLPPILTAATAGTLTINGNGATISRSSAADTASFRIIRLDSGANLILNQVRMTNGLASDAGGILINGGTLTLIDSTVDGNKATEGGGIYNNGGTLMLRGSTVSNNLSIFSGGGIYSYAGIMTLTDSTVSNNTASNAELGEVANANRPYGGGIFNRASTLTLLNSTISNNTAILIGGGIVNYENAILNVVNSTISGNSVTSGGSEQGGGAIINFGSTVNIINSTITNNTAVATALSGIYHGSGSLTIQNSIVANNNGANNCSVTGGTFTDNGNNLDNGTSCGFGGTVGHNTNPLLSPLANNGGPTQTHALLLGSPAINAGNNALALDQTNAALTTDQRGIEFPRIWGAAVDIGAYEALCIGGPYTIPASNITLLIEVMKCTNATTSNEVINLTNSTYTLTREYASVTGLPPIPSTATAGTLTINGNGATITRNTINTPQFRIFLLDGGANLTVNQVRITNGLAASGAGIYNNAGTLTLTGSTIDSSNASNGGGIFNSNGSTTILHDSTLSNNGGSGIYSLSATVILTGSTVDRNSSGSGGGIYSESGSTILRDSTVSNNVAYSYGGGITNDNATLHVINSTISGNSVVTPDVSRGGGAISITRASVVTITNSTITLNSAAATVNQSRSGIWLRAGTLTIRNSIVANNNGANNCIVTGGTFTDNSNNLDNGTSCGFSGAVGQNTNPLLAPLADNGGLTQTHALFPGSPAINAGSNALAVDQNGAALATDQRGTGFPRINNTTVDIGAYETVLAPLNVQLTLQGRTNPAPHPSRVVTVHVSIMPSGGGAAFYTTDFTTDQNSAFTLPNLPTGSYLFSFKGTHTLARQATITVTAGTNNYTTAQLLEGDASDNNGVTLPDFSILATAFGKGLGNAGYDARADFNGDNIITITDFSLLASNFGLAGDGGITP